MFDTNFLSFILQYTTQGSPQDEGLHRTGQQSAEDNISLPILWPSFAPKRYLPYHHRVRCLIQHGKGVERTRPCRPCTTTRSTCWLWWPWGGGGHSLGVHVFFLFFWFTCVQAPHRPPLGRQHQLPRRHPLIPESTVGKTSCCSVFITSGGVFLACGSVFIASGSVIVVCG